MTSANPSQPAQPSHRTVRMRSAVILAIVSLLVGVGIGATGSRPAATSGPQATGIASATQTAAISASPTAEPTPALTTAPAVAPTASPAPVPPKPIVVKGAGSQKTKPFDMPGGDVTVIVTGNGDGNVIAHLVPRGGDALSGESLFNEIAYGKYKYETVVYGIGAGSYYIDMLNSNAWVVTFTPLA